MNVCRVHNWEGDSVTLDADRLTMASPFRELTPIPMLIHFHFNSLQSWDEINLTTNILHVNLVRMFGYLKSDVIFS